MSQTLSCCLNTGRETGAWLGWWRSLARVGAVGDIPPFSKGSFYDWSPTPDLLCSSLLTSNKKRERDLILMDISDIPGTVRHFTYTQSLFSINPKK